MCSESGRRGFTKMLNITDKKNTRGFMSELSLVVENIYWKIYHYDNEL